MLSHTEALSKLKTVEPSDLVQISTRIGKYLGRPIYPASSIVIEEVSDDGGLAAMVKMTYKGVQVYNSMAYHPTLAQCIVFVMAKHW